MTYYDSRFSTELHHVINAKKSSAFDLFLVRIAAARVVILFVFHALVFVGCYAFAYLLRFEFSIPPEFLETFRWNLPVVVGLQLTIGLFFGFYRGWGRYVGSSA